MKDKSHFIDRVAWDSLEHRLLILLVQIFTKMKDKSHFIHRMAYDLPSTGCSSVLFNSNDARCSSAKTTHRAAGENADRH
jgi:hypothetical protein